MEEAATSHKAEQERAHDEDYKLIQAVSADIQDVRELVNSHQSDHDSAKDQELQRLRVVAATVEALKGVRYSILSLSGSTEGEYNVWKVISCGEISLPYDDSSGSDQIRKQVMALGIKNRNHCWRELAVSGRVLVMHPAHFMPSDGMSFPNPRLRVVAGSQSGFVRVTPPDLTVLAKSLLSDE